MKGGKMKKMRENKLEFAERANERTIKLRKEKQTK